MSKEDFAHGVEKASYIYQSVINEYVTENAKLRDLADRLWQIVTRNEPRFVWAEMVDEARDAGIEVE